MKKINLLKKVGLTLGLALTFVQCKKENMGKDLIAVMETNKGKIELVLEYTKTPLTVSNFVALAQGNLPNKLKEGPFYDGITFHRVIADFVVQGGDPTGVGNGDAGYTFKNEIDTALKHDKPGVLSMANFGFDETNSTQFFITLKETPWLDGKHPVFGSVLDTNSVAVLKTLAQGDKIEKLTIETKSSEAEEFVEKAPAMIKEYIAQKEELKKDELKKSDSLLSTLGDDYKDYGLFFIKKTKMGKGSKIVNGSKVTVHYTGSVFATGEKFDSSLDRKEPFEFEVKPSEETQVILGWNEGLKELVEGDEATIIIKPEYAYGDRNLPGIPPNSILKFEIQVLKVK